MSTEHVVSFDAISSEHFVGTCGGCDWKFESNKISEVNRRGLAHERYWATTEKDQPEDQPAQQRSEPNDYTMVELVEQLPAGQHPEDQEMVKINRALINGTPVRIAEDGIFIDYGKDAEPGPPGNVVRVHLELLVDEFRIRRVGADYGQQELTITEGGGLHFRVNRGGLTGADEALQQRLRDRGKRGPTV